MTRPLLILLALTALLLAACAGPRVITSPVGKHRVEAPAKRVPSSGRIPATQKPYRVKGRTYYPLPSSEGYTETGIASWYGRPFHGRKTSNGETYDMHAMTAAHKILPMGTHVLVENLDNHHESVVRVNDRGPFVKGRIIDLSYGAAKDLGMDKDGVARVRVTALGEAVTYRQGGRTIERLLPHKNFQTGEFYVQIGSFVNRANAERLKKQMLEWGRKTVIQLYDRGDSIFYRVQVRAGTELEVARRTERVLTEAGFPGAFVVAR